MCCFFVNRVLYPGGGVSIISSGYERAAKIFYDLAIEVKVKTTQRSFCCVDAGLRCMLYVMFQANQRGDYFPVWGTCLGFEQLTYLTSGKTLLSHTNTSGVPLPLNFSNGMNILILSYQWGIQVQVQVSTFKESSTISVVKLYSISIYHEQNLTPKL